MLNLKTNQEHYFKFIIVFLVFLLLAFDRDLALVYIAIMIADYFWFSFDKNISIPLSRGSSSLFFSLLIAGAAWGLFVFISSMLVTYFAPQSITGTEFIAQAQSIFHLLATSTPILQGNEILTFFGWGLLVPLIETSFFFGRLLEGTITYAETIVHRKISIESFSIPLLVVIVFVGGLFTLFHITAKGLSSIPLLITFVFAIISCLLALYTKQTKEAIFLHIATNSAAVAFSLGWIS